MSYATDDLTPLLAAQPAAGVGFRQGIIRAWDPLTAENTVEVAGALVENLSILNTSEALLLALGHSVGILTSGSSWAILGRLTNPGTPEAASALSAIDTITGEELDQHSTSSATWADLTAGPSVTVNVRPSGRVLIIYNAQIGWAVGTGVPAGGEAGIDVSGANALILSGTDGANRRIRAYTEAGGSTTNVGIFGLGSQKMFTGLNPGATTFKMRYRSLSGHPIDFDNRAIAAILQ